MFAVVTQRLYIITEKKLQGYTKICSYTPGYSFFTLSLNSPFLARVYLICQSFYKQKRTEFLALLLSEANCDLFLL